MWGNCGKAQEVKANICGFKVNPAHKLNKSKSKIKLKGLQLALLERYKIPAAPYQKVVKFKSGIKRIQLFLEKILMKK